MDCHQGLCLSASATSSHDQKRCTQMLYTRHTQLVGGSHLIRSDQKHLPADFVNSLLPFAMQTLERSYLLRINGKVVERPQHMLMRVAVGIHKDDIDSAIQTYHLLSERWFTHASPTLFNSGKERSTFARMCCLCWSASASAHYCNLPDICSWQLTSSSSIVGQSHIYLCSMLHHALLQADNDSM